MSEPLGTCLICGEEFWEEVGYRQYVAGERHSHKNDRRGERVAPWLVMFSQHIPVVREGRVECSCGEALYVGHLVGLIADKHRDLIDRRERQYTALMATTVDDYDAALASSSTPEATS